MRTLLDIDTTYVARHTRFTELILKTQQSTRHEPPYVIWIHGGSGTGKSRFAAQVFDTRLTYWTWAANWFDGYTSEQVHVICDDARPTREVPPNWWLRILDRYPVKLPVKGSSVELVAPVITITSSLSPSAFWTKLNEIHSSAESLTQLTRRLTRVVDMRTQRVELVHCEYQMRMHAYRSVRAQPPQRGYDPHEDMPPAIVPDMFPRYEVEIPNPAGQNSPADNHNEIEVPNPDDQNDPADDPIEEAETEASEQPRLHERWAADLAL